MKKNCCCYLVPKTPLYSHYTQSNHKYFSIYLNQIITINIIAADTHTKPTPKIIIIHHSHLDAKNTLLIKNTILIKYFWILREVIFKKM